MTALASSPKFKTFAIVFSITAAVLYVLSDLLGLTTFTYHPATGRLEWGHGQPRRGEGPVMYWYGWVVTTLVGAAAIGFLATLLPERIIARIPLALIWILPLVAVPIMAWSLMSFWTK